MPKNNYIILVVIILLGIFIIKPQLFSTFSIDQSRVFDDFNTPQKFTSEISNQQYGFYKDLISYSYNSVSEKYDVKSHNNKNLPVIENSKFTLSSKGNRFIILVGGQDISKTEIIGSSSGGTQISSIIDITKNFNVHYVSDISKKSGVVLINDNEVNRISVSNPSYISILIDGDGYSNEMFIKRNIYGENLKFNIEATAFGSNANIRNSVAYKIFPDIRYELPYNCDIQNDETVVRDRFIDAQTISIKDLSYEPIRVCVKQLPTTLRSLTEQGITSDELGTLVKDLSEGKSFTLQDKQVLDIIYITDYLEGMGERCGALDSAYSNKAKKCVKFINEEVDVITIIRESVFREIGSQDVQFTDNLDIGDKPLKSSGLSFTCSSTSNVDTTQKPECFKTTITFNGQSFDFNSLEKKNINPSLRLEYIPEGFYDVENNKIESVKNNFILHFNNFDFFTIMPILEPDKDDYYSLLNQKKELKFKLTNTLSNFQNSGFNVVKRKDFTGEEISELLIYPFSQSDNQEFVLNPDTSAYGAYIYRLLPYIVLNNKKIFIPKESIYNYKVVTEFPKEIIILNQTSFIEKIVEKPIYIENEKIIYQDVFQPFTQKPKSTPTILYVIMGLVVLGVLYQFLKD